MLRSVQHSLLKRQLRRCFDTDEEIPETLRAFLEDIDEAYRGFDTDRAMLERSLDLSSQELSWANSEMRAVLQAIPDLLIHVDALGIVRDYKSGQSADIHPRLERTCIGQGLKDVFPGSVGVEIASALRQSQRTRERVEFEYSVPTEKREERFEARFLPLRAHDTIVLVRCITDQHRLHETLRSVAEGVLATTGDNFFRAIVDHLVRTIPADLAIIAEIREGGVMKTLAVCDRGQLIPNFRRKLADSPFEEIAASSICCYPDNLAVRFPKDRWLKDVGAQGLIGIPLARTGDVCQGFVCVLSRSAFRNADAAQAMLRIIAVRATYELGRKRAEARLTLYREIIANSTEAIAIWDADLRYIDCNTAHERLFGYTADELRAKSAELQLGAETLKKVVQNLRAGGLYRGGHDARNKEGEQLHLEVSVFTVRGPDSETVCHVGIARNVTQQKQMQARLLLADRMASVGTLAAGVAHEINNPLSFVIANLTFAMESLEPLEKTMDISDLREALEAARQGADRVRHIVRDLKTFSRGEETRREPVDIRRAIELALNMAWNEIKHRARLVKDIRKVPMVFGNDARIGQVFLNLLVNAAQAIPEGRADENQIRLLTYAQDDQVIVEVSDSGPGIPPGVLDHIFDPFFTTKEMSGTGLGLAICHGIVSSLGGSIAVETEVGKGTTFRVSLPATVETTVAEEAPVQEVTDVRRGRILVVDDEFQIGASIARTLGREHDVVALTDAHAALNELLNGGHFDLILCDVMMPEMSGMELYRCVQENVPDLVDRIVFVTGGAFTPIAREFLDRVPNMRLEKPFETQNLRALVRQHLAQRDA